MEVPYSFEHMGILLGMSHKLLVASARFVGWYTGIDDTTLPGLTIYIEHEPDQKPVTYVYRNDQLILWLLNVIDMADSQPFVDKEREEEAIDIFGFDDAEPDVDDVEDGDALMAAHKWIEHQELTQDDWLTLSSFANDNDITIEEIQHMGG